MGEVTSWLASADGASDWTRARVCVVGLGSGFSVADVLLERGAQVVLVEDAASQVHTEQATILQTLGAEVRLGPGSTAALPPGVDLVITSPGLPPTHPLLAAAVAHGVPIWGDVELTWRLSHPDKVVPWLAVTGTNGKTTTTQMLTGMIAAAGVRTAAFGNIGRPIAEYLLDPEPYDVLCLELSSFQLHWTSTVRMHSAAVLNLQPDHLEWYAGPFPDGRAIGMAGYGADKARIYSGAVASCVYNVADPATEQMVVDADVTEGCRAIGFTLGIPGVSMLGVVDDTLVDRAFVAARATTAQELAPVSAVQPAARHNIANALAAAALARSYGVPPAAVRDGLLATPIGGHRVQRIAEVDGVTWVDDSKATNPHAAETSLTSFDSVVWIAGGQAKGTTFDELVERVAGQLRGAVLLGVDADVIAGALARHAPQVPVIRVETTETRAMDQAVTAAASLAQPGDVVLLAPGCASKDMFTGYAARGDAFAAAVAARTGAAG